MLQLLMGPDHVFPMLTITAVSMGMLVLAVVDVWRQEVENWATGLLLAITLAGLWLQGIAASQWAGAVLSAATVFTLYLLMGMYGLMGGGDVKLSVVPGLVLGAMHPFLGIWWVAASIAVHQVLFKLVAVGARAAGDARQRSVEALPHVPAMTAAILFSTLVFHP